MSRAKVQRSRTAKLDSQILAGWSWASRTLFDYIRRAMPFAVPGSLTADETYALSAYILTEAKIIDKSMVLNAKTLPLIEMPNRNGFIPDPRPETFK
jgi:S-disulfanyl-L-cysteine oxidoreductase SoxD